MPRVDAMKACQMTVYRPKRRWAAGYVAAWVDPISGVPEQKTLGEKSRRGAFQAAAELAEAVLAGIHDPTTWIDLCDRYEAERLCDKAMQTIQAWRTVKWWIEKHCPIRNTAQINRAWVRRFHSAVAAMDASQNTRATYAAKLRACLRWAAEEGYILQAPKVRVEWEHKPRSRAVPPAEFRRMLAAVPEVRPNDFLLWQRLLRGQWESGLRIGELNALSWDESADVFLFKPAYYWMIGFRRQKNRKKQAIVAMPEFIRVCEEFSHRSGFVFPTPGKNGQMSDKRVVRTIAEIGRAANVVTNDETGKCATTHDLRRAHEQRLKDRFGAEVARMQLRHESSKTTETWYETRGAEQFAALIWGEEE